MREREAEKVVRGWKRALMQFFREQKSRTMSNLKNAKWPIQESRQLWEQGEAGLMLQLFDFEREAAMLEGIMVPYFQQGLGMGMTAASQRVRLMLGFDVSFVPAETWLQEHAIEFGKKFAKMVTETTNEAIRGQLIDALKEGEGIQNMMDRVKKVYKQVDEFRAETIARTETNRAYNSGRLQEYKEMGIKKKKWFFSGTEERCPEGICQANMDEGAIPMGDSFGSGDMAPPAHPNCVCDLIVDEECIEGMEV